MSEKLHILICKMCKKPRPISQSTVIRYRNSGVPDYCSSCARAAHYGYTKPPKRVIRSGRPVNCYEVPCTACGTVRLVTLSMLGKMSRDGVIGGGLCRPCAIEKLKQARKGIPGEAWKKRTPRTPQGDHAVKAPPFHRCHGFRFDPEKWSESCSKYEDCLTYADAKRWDGWTCSNGTPPIRLSLMDRSILETLLGVGVFELTDPFEDEIKGYNLTNNKGWMNEHYTERG